MQCFTSILLVSRPFRQPNPKEFPLTSGNVVNYLNVREIAFIIVGDFAIVLAKTPSRNDGHQRTTQIEGVKSRTRGPSLKVKVNSKSRLAIIGSIAHVQVSESSSTAIFLVSESPVSGSKSSAPMVCSLRCISS